jgi:hydrogenase large subunit
LNEFRRFLEQHFFADRLEAVAALDEPSALARWTDARHDRGDWPRFLALAERLELSALGRADVRLLSAGAFPESDAEGDPPLFKSGDFSQKLQPVNFNPEHIGEDTSHSWFAVSEPRHPSQGETRPDATRANAYSWCKAPRYDGKAAEVGAFARQAIDGQPLVAALAASEGGNIRSRVVARGIEVARLMLAMEAWLREIDERAPFHQECQLPSDGNAVGFVEAARGTLGHWLSVERGLIRRYQIVAPTTWNFSPRDANGQPGPLEQALVGLPAPEDRAGVSVQHVVRSFDPCLACTVH